MTAYKASRGGYKIAGELHDRCTTVVGALPKPWLGAWSAKMVAQAAVENLDLITAIAKTNPDEAVRWLKGKPWEKRDRAAVRGTLVHEIAEAHVQGQPLPEYTDEERPYVEAFEKFIGDYSPRFVEVETTVYDPVLRVAGTFDALAEIDGVHYLCDWKTSAGVYAEYIIQLAFYMNAPLIVRQDGSTQPFEHPRDKAMVLHLRDDGDYEPYELDCDADAFDVFRAALVVQRWAKAHQGWEPTPLVLAGEAAA